MLAFLKHLRERWNNWCGDHDLEVAIRRHLTADGHFGGSAKLSNIRLAAIQRPGWLQVYRFDAVVKRADAPARNAGSQPNPDDYCKLFGLVREDARRDQITVRTFRTTEARRELFESWSVDLIQLRGGQGIF